MRHAAILFFLVAGCSSTGGGGYYRPSDGGAADLFGGTQEDLSTIDNPSLDFAAGPRDMARSFDFATSRPDLRKVFGCNSDLNCYVNNQCSDTACFDACDAMITTPNGLDYLYTYFACLQNECSYDTGGICDSSAANYNQANCTACIQSAKTGNCATDANNCFDDG